MRPSKSEATKKIRKWTRTLLRFDSEEALDESLEDDLQQVAPPVENISNDDQSDRSENSNPSRSNSSQTMAEDGNMAQYIKIHELIREIKMFTGVPRDVTRFISSCRAAHDFIPEAQMDEIPRFLNALKNKLDSGTHNLVAHDTFESIDQFASTIEGIFMISNDPAVAQMNISLKKQKNDETVMSFANSLLELNNEYLTLFKLKNPDHDIESVKVASESYLTLVFLKNLKEPLHTYSRGHFFNTYDEAKKWALDVEKSSPATDNQNFSNKDLNQAFQKFGLKTDNACNSGNYNQKRNNGKNNNNNANRNNFSQGQYQNNNNFNRNSSFNRSNGNRNGQNTFGNNISPNYRGVSPNPNYIRNNGSFNRNFENNANQTNPKSNQFSGGYNQNNGSSHFNNHNNFHQENSLNRPFNGHSNFNRNSSQNFFAAQQQQMNQYPYQFQNQPSGSKNGQQGSNQ
jgi:hypothetical protein